jgi:hypothetical protein
MICRNAARHALMLHQWMVAPDFDVEGEVQKAGQRFAGNAAPAETLRSRPRVACTPWLAGGGRSNPGSAATYAGRRCRRPVKTVPCGRLGRGSDDG